MMWSRKVFVRLVVSVLIALNTALPPRQALAMPKFRPKLAACSLLLVVSPVSDTPQRQSPVATTMSEVVEASAQEPKAPTAQELIEQGSRTKLDSIFGHRLAAPTPERLSEFRKQWAPLVKANEKAGVIPSSEAYLAWWTQNEEEILKERNQYPADMSLQGLFLWTATLHMATDHPMEVFASWVEQNANSGSLKATEGDGQFFSGLLALLQGIVIGALAAGPISNLLVLAIEPKFREFRVKWARFWEQAWGYFGSKFKKEKEKPRPFAELSREQIRQIKRARDELNGLGYTATPENLLALEVFMKQQWALVHGQWLQYFTGVEREGRTIEWDAKYFRPDHFAERVAAALARAEVYAQGFTQLRREIMHDFPEKSSLLRERIDALSKAVHEYRFHEQRDPAKAAEAQSLMQQIQSQISAEGVEKDELDRLVQNRHFVYIEKRRAVFEMVMHLKHIYEFREFTQGLPSEVYKESLQLRNGLGLDDFHREYSEQVRAMAKGFGYHLEKILQEVEAQQAAS